MMIKIGNLTQTHEVVGVFGFEPHFFQSSPGGFETRGVPDVFFPTGSG